MNDLPDDLIEKLAKQNTPYAYSHEVKYMAQEILRWRQKAKNDAAAQAASATGTMPNPYGGIPYPGSPPP